MTKRTVSRNEVRVLEYIRDHPGCPVRDVREALGLPHAAQKALYRLKGLGLVVAYELHEEQRNRHYGWKLTDAGAHSLTVCVPADGPPAGRFLIATKETPNADGKAIPGDGPAGGPEDPLGVADQAPDGGGGDGRRDRALRTRPAHGSARSHGEAVGPRPGDAQLVDPVDALAGPVIAWLMDGSKIAARQATRGQYSKDGEPLVLLRGATVLQPGNAFDEADARYSALELRSVMVSAIAPMEQE